MKILYKNKALEKLFEILTSLNAAVVIATFIMLYGLDAPLMSVRVLHLIQIAAFMFFLAEKTVRFVNAYSKLEYLQSFWFEIPLIVILVIVVLGSDSWSAVKEPAHAKMFALALYLVAQVIVKTCYFCVNLASSGKNPAKSLIIIFLLLIIIGASLLVLPKSHNGSQLSFVDALFTATSATCVTGLIVKDTGSDFTYMGQIIILILIQLGGLGIVIFGAVLALLLGQALSVRESVAMQDLLNAQTLGKIGNIITFIFMVTIVVEAAGAVALLNMWETLPSVAENIHRQWFYSIFHSISAFCNAGFSLCSESLVDYSNSTGVYSVIAPLIILGGLGFGVLYNIATVVLDKTKHFFRKNILKSHLDVHPEIDNVPVKIMLQTKIVLTMTIVLVIFGMVLLMIFGHNRSIKPIENIAAAFFQSVTARTAGFNTLDISSMTAANKLILIVLMFIGGSPGSTAGGIKTVTLAVLVMAVYSTLHKRRYVEIFKRSIKPDVVGRAITVIVIFTAVLITATLALSYTEQVNKFSMGDIIFESASALGTVGLSTGITPDLTSIGKLIIIAVMLIGRLGPLTLLASMTFNLKVVGYDYPSEPIIVG